MIKRSFYSFEQPETLVYKKGFLQLKATVLDTKRFFIQPLLPAAPESWQPAIPSTIQSVAGERVTTKIPEEGTTAPDIANPHFPPCCKIEDLILSIGKEFKGQAAWSIHWMPRKLKSTGPSPCSVGGSF